MAVADQEPTKVETVEIIETNSVIGALARAELDQQITTARAFPRSITRFRKECLEMAGLNETVARECIYAVPRDGKMIEGPSARLAEIVASAWGNCRAGARVVEEGTDFITAQGVFQDMERNVSITYEIRRRITGKNGRRYSPDMISTTANAACSIALRNAVFKGVPKAFWSEAYGRARQIVAGDAETVAKRRGDIMDAIKKMGLTQERILAAVNVEGIADLGADELVQLQGMANAVREGELNIDEAFPDPKKSAPVATESKGVAGIKDALEKKSDAPPPAPPSGPPPTDKKEDETVNWTARFDEYCKQLGKTGSDRNAIVLKHQGNFEAAYRELEDEANKG